MIAERHVLDAGLSLRRAGSTAGDTMQPNRLPHRHEALVTIAGQLSRC